MKSVGAVWYIPAEFDVKWSEDQSIEEACSSVVGTMVEEGIHTNNSPSI